MPTVNQVQIGGYLNLDNNNKISGDLSVPGGLTGSLSNSLNMGGSVGVPSVVDRTAIHYATTNIWNSDINLISEKGHIYVYSDYSKKIKEDGTTEVTPAIKIGDGTSYLIDLPFFSSGNNDEFIDHINNASIHVSDIDRYSWDNKLSASIDEENENLFLSII